MKRINYYNNKRLLITGATGLIGSNLAIKILEENENVDLFLLARNKNRLMNCIDDYQHDPRLHLIASDICDYTFSDGPFDYIFHAAGPMEGDVIKNNPLSVISPNIFGTFKCFNYLLKQKIDMHKPGRIVIFSSVTVYGDNRTKKHICVDEEDTFNAFGLNTEIAPYSESKRMSEIIGESFYKQYNCDVVFCRFSTVYGYTRFMPNTAFFSFLSNGLCIENFYFL